MRNSAKSREKEQFWRWVLQEQRQSGLTAKAFCQQQGVSLPSFYAWRRKIQERDAHPKCVADPQQSLVPVTVVDSGGNHVSQQRCAKSIEIITPSGLIIDTLKHDPLSGHLFLFVNRRRDKLKILYWDGDGLAIWYRRLEQGTFQMPKLGGDQATAEIRADELTMLIRGIDYSNVRRRKRFSIAS